MVNVTVDKHGDKWRYRFEGAKVDGKRSQFSKSGFATKREALDAGRKAATAYATTGEMVDPFTSSFSDLLTEWLEHYCKNHYKNKTYKGYTDSVKTYIIKELGKYSVQNVTTRLLQEFINTKFKEGYARATLRNMHTVLKSCFRYAVEDRHYLYTNPALGVRIPSHRVCAEHGQDSVNPNVYLKPDVLDQIFAKFPEGTPAHLPLMLGYKCGLRVGEVYGLTWEDVDFENSTITVNRQMQYSGNPASWYLTPPKYDSVRTINVDKECLALLKRTKIRQSQDRLRRGKNYVQNYVTKDNIVNVDAGEPINLVNTRTTGYYCTPSTVRYASQIIREELHYPEFTFHSMRHTHGSMLAESGVPVKFIMERLGHSTVDVTVKYYMSVTDRMTQVGKEAIESLYAGS